MTAAPVWTMAIWLLVMTAVGVVRLAHDDPPVRSWRGGVAAVATAGCGAVGVYALWLLLTT